MNAISDPMTKHRHISWASHAILALGLALASQIATAGERGQEVYRQYCHICHGTGMADVPQIGNQAQWEARIEKGIESLYEGAVKGHAAMPPMGLCDSCTDQDVMDAVDYLVFGVE